MRGYNGSTTTESVRDLWQTPKFVFDYYNKRFGFNLDLAASEDNSLCEHFITAEEDALDIDSVMAKMMSIDINHDCIVSACWLNPPYSDITPWVEVAEYISSKNGLETPVVMLVPADTSVKWFKLAFDNCSECHFISGRLAFINSETQKPVSGNNKGSVVFIFDYRSPFKSQVALINREDMK